MFGIGIGELILIGVLVLVFVGPKDLPRILGTIGKTLRELKDAAQTVKETVIQELDDDGKKNDPPRAP